jgi:hypothetical protein
VAVHVLQTHFETLRGAYARNCDTREQRTLVWAGMVVNVEKEPEAARYNHHVVHGVWKSVNYAQIFVC